MGPDEQANFETPSKKEAKQKYSLMFM